MILDASLFADAHRQGLELRERELTNRMHFYDARTVERLERELTEARGRLQVSTSLVSGVR